MATCQIWEYYASGNNRNQTAKLPGKAPQNITISSSAAQSAAFDNATIGIRLLTDTDCWFLYGSNPTATTSNGIKLNAGSPEYFDIPLAAGGKLSIVTA